MAAPDHGKAISLDEDRRAMSGQSPSSMMRAPPRRPRPQPASGYPQPRRRLWTALAAIALLVVVAAGWAWGWYYAASIASRALSGWIDREAALGRHYDCGSQSIGGFPLQIEIRCSRAAAQFASNKPPFDVQAGDVSFSAAVYRPALLHGDIAGPVTLADPGQPPRYVANWSRGRLDLLGLPGDPEGLSISFEKPRLDRAGGTTGMIFQAGQVDVDSRIIEGSARLNPVIETTAHVEGALAPDIHPVLGAPLQADLDVVLRGFKDFSPKPWPILFRDMRAAGGSIDIKSFRIERPDAAVVGTGALTVDDKGRLQGTLNVAVAGLENIVPLLGIDQLIGQGVDRLTGGSGSAAQGLSALDRLMPGLSGIVRQSSSSSVIESINKMGQPTEIDKKPAIALPLRVADGIVYVGLIPVGMVPPLF